MSNEWAAPLLASVATILVAAFGYLTTRHSTGRQQQSGDVRTLIDELQEEVRAARGEAREARIEAREARAEARAANERADLHRGELEAMRRDLTIERAANERLTAINREQSDEITALRARVTRLEGGC